MDKKRVTIYHNGKPYERTFDIDYIIKAFPLNIRNALLNGSYIVEAKVSDNIFHIYLSYMEDPRDIPEIDQNNVYELHLLDNEFQLLHNTFQEEKYQQLLKSSHLNEIMYGQKDNILMHEKFIAQNLDYFIKYYSDEMSQISLKSLKNIFSHPERILANQEAAYHFITQTIPKNPKYANQSNHWILLDDLKCSKLSPDSVLDSFNKRKERLGFMPETDFSVDEVTDGAISFLRIQMDDKNGLIQSSLEEDERQCQLAQNELTKLRWKIRIDKFNLIPNIAFPNFLRVIPNAFCRGMTGLKRVTIPLSTHSIGDGAFSGCINLVEINIPSTVIEIHDNAFRGCSSLCNISLPSSISLIGMACFAGCSSLRSISIPPSVTIISDYLFDHCRSLIEVNLPSGIQRIGAHAFDNCISLQDFELPASLESIGEGAMNFCTSIVNLEIPSSVTCIEKNSFKGCKSLLLVKIPPSVKSIGACAFQECKILGKVENMAEITTIEQSLFYECSNLTAIELPLSITSIEKNAFCSLTQLKEIYLPSSITIIGDNAFRNCKSLERIELPEKLKRIGNCAFFLCVNLTDVNFPNSLESIGESAFIECVKLANVEIPSSVNFNHMNSFPVQTQIKQI